MRGRSILTDLRWPGGTGTVSPQPPVCAGRTAGFTLIEVLVAFTILAILTIVVQRGVIVSVGGIARADERVGAEMVARTLMTGPLGSGPDAGKPGSGRLNGYDWSLRLEPLTSALPLGADGAATEWMPMRMKISVWRPGAARNPYSIETVRLVRVSP